MVFCKFLKIFSCPSRRGCFRIKTDEKVLIFQKRWTFIIFTCMQNNIFLKQKKKKLSKILVAHWTLSAPPSREKSLDFSCLPFDRLSEAYEKSRKLLAEPDLAYTRQRLGCTYASLIIFTLFDFVQAESAMYQPINVITYFTSTQNSWTIFFRQYAAARKFGSNFVHLFCQSSEPQ